jgi:hypothetical protein
LHNKPKRFAHDVFGDHFANIDGTLSQTHGLLPAERDFRDVETMFRLCRWHGRWLTTLGYFAAQSLLFVELHNYGNSASCETDVRSHWQCNLGIGGVEPPAVNVIPCGAANAMEP